MNDFALSSRVCWQITLTLLHVSSIGILIGLVAATGSRVLKGCNPCESWTHAAVLRWSRMFLL